MRNAAAGALALLLASAGRAIGQDEDMALRNWFEDPFLQLTGADAATDCPQPAGPFVTQRERMQQSHRRAEKGTTAWLAGEAERPRAYAYDAEIAQALAAAFRAPVASPRFPGSALWATVQGRVVYIEGCVARAGDAAALEALARSLPHVQQAIAIVRSTPTGSVPYRVMPPAPPGSGAR
ncbi:MAG TPA: BON domain-containing protein [Roseateles sp.]|nr:BON domain-containing protein [Roseateles sp.]